MDFVSLSFLVFSAVVCITYFAVPKNMRWITLLIASYIFYYINSKWLVVVLFGETLVTFAIGLIIAQIYKKRDAEIAERGSSLAFAEKRQIKAAYLKKAKLFLVLGVLFLVGMILYLKYYNFFISPVNALSGKTGFHIRPHDIILPLGISFYSLQAIAYITDVYHGKIAADRNLPKFMLFMSFFPQIVQGPIPRYSQLASQLYEGHSFDYKRVCFGAQLLLWGLMKKLIIADRITVPVDQIFDNFTNYHGMIVFLAAVGYGIQVYTDFSGGMDIARGVAQIVGIDLELNFRQPFFSTSIEEFWRRWHITLGGFMRDYVFYPLSLSKPFSELGKKLRKVFGPEIGKRVPAFIAMFIVYFLVGFWHGASWKYIAFGLWNGVFIATGILLVDVYAKMRELAGIDENTSFWQAFKMLRTFCICSYGRFFSRGLGMTGALTMMVSTLDRWYDLSFIVDGSLTELGLDTANWFVLVAAILVLMFVDYIHEKNISIREVISEQYIVFRWIIYIAAILIVLIFGIWGPAYDSASFIYEQF